MHSPPPTTTPDAAYLRLFVNPTRTRDDAGARILNVEEEMMATTSTTPTRTGTPLDRPARYFVARSIASAAALIVYGCPYRGIAPAGGRLGFRFADPDDVLPALEAALRARTAPPVQPRDVMLVYFDLRAALARAKAAQERRQGTTRQEADR